MIKLLRKFGFWPSATTAGALKVFTKASSKLEQVIDETSEDIEDIQVIRESLDAAEKVKTAEMNEALGYLKAFRKFTAL